MPDMDYWIKKYEDKTGEEFKPSPGFKLFFIPTRGFCEVMANAEKEMMIVRQLSGDAIFWKDFVEAFCQAIGYHRIGTYCIRNIIPYIRMGGFHIDRTEETPDGLRYFCTDNIGRHGQASPAWITAKGIRAYYITWEV